MQTGDEHTKIVLVNANGRCLSCMQGQLHTEVKNCGSDTTYYLECDTTVVLVNVNDRLLSCKGNLTHVSQKSWNE
jgi:hypothetical protein